MICSHCGSVLENDIKICSHCGKEVSQQSAVENVVLNNEPAKQANGLGGGLIFIIIGILLTLGFQIVTIHDDLKEFRDGTVDIVTRNSPNQLLPHFLGFITFEVLAATSITLLGLFLIYLFFKKKQVFPHLYLVYLVICNLYILTEIIVLNSYSETIKSLLSSIISESYTQLARALVVLLVWGTYIKISKRSKRTFVEPIHENEKRTGLILATTAVLFLAVAGMNLNKFITPGPKTNIPITNQADTESLVRATVEQIKKELNPPYKYDEITTLTDITAEKNTIVYHYELRNVDQSKISTDYFRTSLHTNVCNSNEIKDLLNSSINIRYVYVDTATQKEYSIPFQKSDCE